MSSARTQRTFDVPGYPRARFSAFDLGVGRSGPTVTIAAGMGGTAYPGIEACWRIIRSLEASPLNGRVTVIPILDVAGFMDRTTHFCTLDGAALIHAFRSLGDNPPVAHGSATHALARVAASMPSGRPTCSSTCAAARSTSNRRTGWRRCQPTRRRQALPSAPPQSRTRACAWPSTHNTRRPCRLVVRAPWRSSAYPPWPSAPVASEPSSKRTPRFSPTAWTQSCGKSARSNGNQPTDQCRRAWLVPERGRTVLRKRVCRRPAVSAGECVRAGQRLGQLCDYFGVVLETVDAPFDGWILSVLTTLAVDIAPRADGDTWFMDTVTVAEAHVTEDKVDAGVSR